MDVVVGAKVSPEKKARLIETAGANGKTVNDVLNSLVDEYLNDHQKLEHPEKEAKDEAEELVLVTPDEETIEEFAKMDGKEFQEKVIAPMWEDFENYAKSQGYSLVKTETLRKIVAVLKTKAKLQAKADNDDFICPECDYSAKKKFSKCPKCGANLRWD